MNKATHYEEWAALWEAAKDVSKGKTSWDRNARESFELVAIALLYQRNAIEMYEEEARHGALRTSEAGAGPSIPWPSEEPLFPKMMESGMARSCDVDEGQTWVRIDNLGGHLTGWEGKAGT